MELLTFFFRGGCKENVISKNKVIYVYQVILCLYTCKYDTRTNVSVDLVVIISA